MAASQVDMRMSAEGAMNRPTAVAPIPGNLGISIEAFPGGVFIIVPVGSNLGIEVRVVGGEAVITIGGSAAAVVAAGPGDDGKVMDLAQQEELLLDNDQYSVAGNAGGLSDQGEPLAGHDQPVSFLAVAPRDLEAMMRMTNHAIPFGGTRNWNAVQNEAFGMGEWGLLDTQVADASEASESDDQSEESNQFVAKETRLDDDMLLEDFEM